MWKLATPDRRRALPVLLLSALLLMSQGCSDSSDDGGSDSGEPELLSGRELALESAQDQIGVEGESPPSLMDELTALAGFSKPAATFAVHNVDVNWRAEALEVALARLDRDSGYSRDSLMGHLWKADGFSKADAAYALDNVAADWEEQAVEVAESYLDSEGLTKSELLETLESDGFTPGEAQYAVDTATGARR